LIIYIWKSWFR